MTRRLYEIEQSAIDDLRDRLNDLISDENITDVDQIEGEYHNELCEMISEIADSNMPIYTADILQCALDNLYLATEEPELGPAFDGTPTPINIIAANIYEYIEEKLWEYIKDDLDSDAKVVFEPREYKITLNDKGYFVKANTALGYTEPTFWKAFNEAIDDAYSDGLSSLIISWSVDPSMLADRLISRQASHNTRKDA